MQFHLMETWLNIMHPTPIMISKMETAVEEVMIC